MNIIWIFFFLELKDAIKGNWLSYFFWLFIVFIFGLVLFFIISSYIGMLEWKNCKFLKDTSISISLFIYRTVLAWVYMYAPQPPTFCMRTQVQNLGGIFTTPFLVLMMWHKFLSVGKIRGGRRLVNRERVPMPVQYIYI